MTMLAKTATRVADNTPDYLNDRILERTADRVARIASKGEDAIHRRLDELDREWDIERALMTNASLLSLAGIVLGATRSKAFYALTGTVAAFLLQHSLQGWCPPIRPLRTLGFRTPREIEDERHALLQELQRLNERR
jgi:hypothetical protein